MDPGIFLALSGAIVGVLSAFFAFLQGRLASERHAATGGESLEDRITKLTNALAESTSLISQIEDEISQRQSVVTKLEQDAKTYLEIVNLKQSEVEAVAQVVRGEIKSEGRRSFWVSFWIQFGLGFFFFVLGVVATLLAT